MSAAVDYHVHRSLALDSVLSQLNPVHILISYFIKVRFSIFSSTPSPPSWLFPLFSNGKSV
jgi:hypothetical protein